MSKRPASIPIPARQRLHELRTRVAPLLVFGAAALVAVMLWRDSISPAMLVGEVMTVKSSVSTPVAATIQRVRAQRLQAVRAGDVIAELRAADPRQTMDLIQSELSLLRVETEAASPAAASRREVLDFERLRLDWMTQKVELAKAKADARKAAMELEVAEGLSSSAGASKRFIEEARLAKESAEAEAAARQEIVDALDRRIAELGQAATASAPAPSEALAKAIASIEQRLRAIEENHSVITLRAPMDGVVSEVFRRDGENVVAGEPLVMITAAEAERIMGYLRQPFPLEPAVGMEVEVRTQGRDRRGGIAAITRVGVHFEPIANPALHPAPTPEVGLPVEISLPPNLRLRPGELVSLVIRPQAGGKSAP